MIRACRVQHDSPSPDCAAHIRIHDMQEAGSDSYNYADHAGSKRISFGCADLVRDGGYRMLYRCAVDERYN